jgi:hypothetical protein
MSIVGRKWLLGMVFMFALLHTTIHALHQWDEPIQDVFVLSDAEMGHIQIRVWLNDTKAKALRNTSVSIEIEHPDGTVQNAGTFPFTLPPKGNYTSIESAVDSAVPWSPKNPNLYHLRMTFTDGDGACIASFYQRFGIRKLETRNARFFVNGKPFYVRACGGEGGCGCDDLSPEEIRKRLLQTRRFGFNAIRHHTHVPSDTYMDIADEVGLFIQMEIGGTAIGNDPKSERFQKASEEWRTMIRMARRHPSAFIYSVGNEIYLNDPGLVKCLDTLYDTAKEMDPGTFVLNRSGSNPFNDDFGKYDLIERPIGEYEHVAEFAREDFMLYLRGNRKGRSDRLPIIAHEYPLIASYPNPELAGKYDKTPDWIQVAVENARKNGLEHLLPLYVRNTERIQALCRKEMLEEARKFPELDGYNMLRFVDCGNYVSGVVNDFADPKNVTCEEFLRTNGETVLLCTWNQRSFHYGDTLTVDIEISHHGEEPFTTPLCRWWLMDGPQVISHGEFKDVRVQPVDVARIGTISVVIPELPSAAKLTLRAVLPDTKSLINNEWYFWAFPSKIASPEIQRSITLWDPRNRLSVYMETYKRLNRITKTDWTPAVKTGGLVISDSWQEAFYDFLEKGGRLWIISDKTWPWPEEIGIFGLHITRILPGRQSPPVFPELDEKLTNWLTICSNNPKREGNSGTIIYRHPALSRFPHEGFCDLQFWPMIYRAKSLRLADFPPGTEPIIRTIDNFHTGRSKGYMVELRVGKGGLFISTLNLTQSFPWAVATRYMFDELLHYTTGPDFTPSVHMSAAELKATINGFAAELAANPRQPLNEMGARYETVWRKRLQPGELVVLPVFDARGIDQNRLGVHYEYAQTQFYYAIRPGESMSWECKTQMESTFTCVLFLASPLKKVPLLIKVDERESLEAIFTGGKKWDEFVQLDVIIPKLAPGKHILTLSIPRDAPSRDGQSIQIQDVELRSTVDRKI